MDIRVKDLKVGARLCFGRYNVFDDLTPATISWLKADKDCGFVSEHVLDIIRFDAGEQSPSGRFRSNPDYYLSNIFQWMNSDENRWFTKSHPMDEPPTGDFGYVNHYGFLHHFSDYEKLSIVSDVELLKIDDLIGPKKLPIFKRKGLRARLAPGYPERGRGNVFVSMLQDVKPYIPYWLRDAYPKPEEYRANAFMANDALPGWQSPSGSNGFRPFVRLNPDTPVEVGIDGVYHIKRFDVEAVLVTAELDDTLSEDFTELFNRP